MAKEDNITVSIVRCISHLERHRRKYINEHLSEQEMRGSMFLAINYLNHNPGCSQDRLCSELIIDKGNAARMCRQLEDMGYIRREQSPDDRRQNMLFLTEEGEKQIPLIHEQLMKWRKTATQGLNEEELDTLIHLLDRMMKNVSDME